MNYTIYLGHSLYQFHIRVLIKDNQQECSRISNWLSLQCLGPWVNCSPPVWWSTYRFTSINESWCVSLIYWGGIFYWIFPFNHVLYTTQVLPNIFSPNIFFSEITFFTKSKCAVIFRNLDFFLLIPKKVSRLVNRAFPINQEASWWHCCKFTCQISDRYHISDTQSHGYDMSLDHALSGIGN